MNKNVVFSINIKIYYTVEIVCYLDKAVKIYYSSKTCATFQKILIYLAEL